MLQDATLRHLSLSGRVGTESGRCPQGSLAIGSRFAASSYGDLLWISQKASKDIYIHIPVLQMSRICFEYKEETKIGYVLRLFKRR
jgi:hypothetical protein